MSPKLASPPNSYDAWSREELISRLQSLDQAHLRRNAASYNPPRKPSTPFDFAAHPKRKIALKLSYHGSEYSGMEFQRIPPAVPTVEKVLFDAMVKTKLVDGAAGLEGCGWERCGRTDKGVSGAQQVVSLWVRSALGEPPTTRDQESTSALDNGASETEESDAGGLMTEEFGGMGDWDEPPSNTVRNRPSEEPTELRYVSSLNNVLPSSIRILAWSPVAPDFSARFNCQYRHYKYFFTSDGLDIAAMRDAARRLEGGHDFRNLCKIDPQKQLTSFKRTILQATVNPVDEGSRLYVFDLKGTAFLYNQVRHIMAILFLVGTNLESPSIVSALMNVDAEDPLPPFTPNELAPPVVATKPSYQMADPLPLVLWDCGYNAPDVQWHIDADFPEGSVSSQRELASNIINTLRGIHERALLRLTLDAHFLKAASLYHQPPTQYFPLNRPDAPKIPEGSTLSVPLGGGTFRRGAKYEPLLERERSESADVVNEKWRTGRGAKKWAQVLEKKKMKVAAGDSALPVSDLPASGTAVESSQLLSGLS